MKKSEKPSFNICCEATPITLSLGYATLKDYTLSMTRHA